MIDLKAIQEAILEEATIAARQVMIRAGVPAKSDLIKNTEMTVDANGAFVLLSNDYYIYLSEGRRPRARKVPIKPLLDWIKKYRIKGRNKRGRFITNNQLAFAIQNGIFKNGIRGRKYADKVDNVTLEILAEQTTELLSESVADAMFSAFTKT